MEVVAFLIMAAILIVAVFRVTRGMPTSERGLRRREAARESKMILREVSESAGLEEGATKVDDENRIIHSGPEH